MSDFNHFNLIGPLYDRIFGRHEDHKIVEIAELREGQTLLDVGGGTGRVTRLFKKISKNVIIADSARSMLGEAQKKELRTVNSQSEHLPFGGRTFDRVIMVDALHHVADQQKTLNEMWRVTGPGGKIIIEEPDIQHFLVKLVALGEKLLLMRSHFLSPQAIARMSRFNGEASVEIVRKSGIAWIIITREQQQAEKES